MNKELQLKLQAYADGELSGREAGEIGDWLAENADAQALVAELKNANAALAGYEEDIKLPESPEFYWSKIEREIQRLRRSESPKSGASLFAVWRRFLVPAGALAALVILGLLAFPLLRGPKATASAESEFTLADSGTFTYHDYDSGTTLVWLDYPAENEFTEAESADMLN